MDIWTPSTFAQAGMLISDTATPGRVYQMSSEHHVRNEIEIRRASNWAIYALQTEEEHGESAFALPLFIADSSNITLANFHLYRVVGSYQPFPNAVSIENSRNIRFRNFHCYSDSKVSFDNSIRDVTHGVDLRQREFAWLTISGDAPRARKPEADPVLTPGNQVKKVAGGFFNISGAAVDAEGQVYFVDAHWQRIYRWSPQTSQLSLVRDSPLQPVQLAFDKAGDLLVVSYKGDGTVYSFKPGAPGNAITLLKAELAVPRPGATPILPVDVWRNENDFQQAVTAPNPYQFLSPDGSVFLPVSKGFLTGALYYGVKMQSVLRAFGVAPVMPGKTFYICDENQERTYAASVAADGTISDLKLFAERGGEAVTSDSDGNVYIAAGQIYVYSKGGELLSTIRVPERPLNLVFGGADRKTLFIAARTSLYAVRLKFGAG
jgi:sugar lactone lactonase YvrE